MLRFNLKLGFFKVKNGLKSKISKTRLLSFVNKKKNSITLSKYILRV